MDYSSVKLKFNGDWRFSISDIKEAENISFDDSQWELVSLPHTPKIEKVDVVQHFQGVCWYRKHFKLDPSYRDRKVFIEFEAAMQVADVWVNGVHKTTHRGGYLPFTLDITEEADLNRENVIAVRLDNSDNPDVPPGKPLNKLDFSYFGGLYRNVWLIQTGDIHITDAVYANQVAGGGIFVAYSDVSGQSAKVHVKTNIKNKAAEPQEVQLITSIKDCRGNIVAQGSKPIEAVQADSDYTFEEAVIVEKPDLWHPDHPYLYTLETKLENKSGLLDRRDTRIGIRTISCGKPDGFAINGKPLRLRGANRHQQYPYIGNAASDNAQYREAVKLKRAGFNFLRLCHYPQSVAFLDACDELGLMVVEPIPGWQFCKEGMFKDIVFQNVRDMIRRDRNHPSTVMWEVSLNETGDTEEFVWDNWSGATDEFYHQLHLTAHEEYSRDQMFTSGDTTGRRNAASVDFDIPYTEWDRPTMTRHMRSIPRKMGFDREYGDFEFGGNYSTTRQIRGNGEEALLLSAWNFQWSHNKNRGYTWSVGDSIWVGIDYNRGYYPEIPLCTCGIMDTFRLPKFSYYFYQSQSTPNDSAVNPHSKYMVYIANYWTERTSPAKVIVYSNCGEVELFLNGKSIGRRKADSGGNTEYKLPKGSADPNYWLEQKEIKASEESRISDDNAQLEQITGGATNRDLYFDGGNCRNLEHAPFTFFNIPYERGELKAVGMVGGRAAVECTRITPGELAYVTVSFDLSGRELEADGADFVFVRAEIKDRNGTVVPDACNKVTFWAEGPVQLIGKNPVEAEAGIASIILKACGRPGTVKVYARAEGLQDACGEIRCVQAQTPIL